MKKLVIACMLIAMALTLSACQRKELLLVTTTSVENSGLLEYLLPYFEEEHGVKVRVTAVGTGAALNYGRLGQADVLIVHDEKRELEFMEAGYGEKRAVCMYNDFIFVGPDSLNGQNLENALETLTEQHYFYSRGDNSGTHLRELDLWETHNIDINRFGSRYKETGQSMESTLMMTSFKGYYTLSDRATFLAMNDNLDLTIAYEEPDSLRNDYGLIKVDPSLHNRDDSAADLFYEWMLSKEAKQLILAFTVNDEPLFTPNE